PAVTAGSLRRWRTGSCLRLGDDGGSRLSPGTLVSGVAVTLEIGRRRSFAQAVDWPGWCRAGKGGDRAGDALVPCAARCRAAAGALAAPPGAGAPEIPVIGRVDGAATTEFGAPGQTMPSDRRPLTAGEPERLAAFLDACWAAFDGQFAAIP